MINKLTHVTDTEQGFNVDLFCFIVQYVCIENDDNNGPLVIKV